MALVRSRSAELFQNKTTTSTTRQLQQALYHLLDDLEKTAFIEALSQYRTHRDIFELVNGLRKILNTPVKRQLFPLVRRVIRPEHVAAFDLITKDVKQHNTITLPYLYRPHMADLNVLKKYRAGKTPTHQRNPLVRSWAGVAAEKPDKPAGSLFRKAATLQRVNGHNKLDINHKTLSKGSPASDEDADAEILEIDIGEPDSEDEGYGFTIRGGAEAGVGVYVSSVDNGSPAQKQGLCAGDLILEANNISFNNIQHEEAARIIKAATRLRVTVSRVGRIPSSHAVHEAYRWTDPKGRPVSPPLDRGGTALGDDDERRRSGSQMLKASDERKINIVLQKGQGLGILIRGGKEYGLGIFVSGIDHYSVAENAGMKLGDQILDVNGTSFLDISNAEAVSLLQSSRHLIITVKDVGKIPFAKTTIDERGWIESSRVGSVANSLSWSSRKSASGSLTDQDAKKKIFSRGVGTQLMLTSSMGKTAQKEQIHEQARLLLNDSEHSTLNYYLSEYEKKTINIRGMAHALLELLNTPAKLTLMSEIRATVRPADLATFDQLIAKSDLQKSLNQARKLLAPDIISLSSFDSDDVIDTEKYKRTLFSHPKTVLLQSQNMDILNLEDNGDTDWDSYDLSETSQRLSKSTPNLTNIGQMYNSQEQTISRRRSRSPWAVFATNRKSKSKEVLWDTDSRAEVSNLKADFPKSKEVSPRELSGPQQKILNHLQLRKAQEEQQTISNKNARNHHTNSKMTSRISSSETRRSYNFVEHVAEVHESPERSDNDEDLDLSDLSTEDSQRGSSEDPSRNEAYISQAAKETSRRSLHRIRLKETSRLRSKSKSKSIEDFSDVNDYEQIRNTNGEPNDHTSKQSSALLHLSVKPRPRKDKSPFRQMWHHFKQNGNITSVNGASENPDERLTINGQIISTTRDSDESSAVANNRQEEEEDIEDDVFDFLENDANHVDVDITDPRIGGNRRISKPSADIHKSKAALFSRARKSLSNESSPTKVGGVTSSRYKSPRRDKQVSKINVPLIKVDSTSNDKTDEGFDDVKKGGNFLTVIQYNGQIKAEQKPNTRITISNQQTDPDANVLREDSSPGGRGSGTNQRRNVTSISVGHVSTRGSSNQSMEEIKRQATEKYGDIPLDIVYIYRSKPTLGVAIEGGANTRQPLPKVISVQPGGSAFESGGLKVGHVILEVNGQPVVGLPHMDAARLIAEAFKNRDHNRMELLVTPWSDSLLDAIKVDVGMLKSR